MFHSGPTLPLVVLGVRDSVKADCTVAQVVYETTLRLPETFVDPLSSPMNMDLNAYTSRLTNAMRSAKHVFVQPVLLYSTHVTVNRESIR